MTAGELYSRLISLGIKISAEQGQIRVSAARGQLTDDLRKSISENRAELLELLVKPGAGDRFELVRASRDGAQDLSFFQERLWILQQLDPDSTTYNMVVEWPEGNRYSARQLADGIRDVVQRHDILRSIFREEGGSPRARVLPVSAVPIEIRHVADGSAQEGRRLMDAAIEAAACKPFDLTAEPPIRFVVAQSDSKYTVILVAVHHIASDAWSLELLRSEVRAACERLLAGSAVSVTEPFRYADFAAWQRQAQNQLQIASQLAWWEARLVNSPQLCLFPPELLINDRDMGGATYDFSFDSELSEAIRRMVRAEGVTVYMALVAVCSVVLQAHTGQHDIVLGCPMGSRERPEFEAIIGPFVNLLVLRLDLVDSPTFAELLRSARDAVIDAYDHRDVPFELLINRLRPARTFNHSPLFQVAVVMHNATDGSGAPIHSGGSIHDFTWFARETGGRIENTIEYRADLYTRHGIERIARQFETIVRSVIEDRNARVADISLIDANERERVVETFNSTSVDIDLTTVAVQFEHQVVRSADRCAISFAGREVSYAELNQRSNQLANYLISCGISSGSLIALCLERSPELVIALLAVQKAGAAYVPLDPGFPRERLNFMLADSGAALIITMGGADDLNVPADVRIIDLATERAHLDGLDATNLATRAGPDDLAYLIYTSGSLGQPKGVKISHGALSNFLGSMRSEPGLASTDVLAAVTSVSFDIAGLELYLPLIVGARIELISRETAAEGTALALQLDTCGATMLQATPITLRQLIEADWHPRPGFRVLCGGEALQKDLADALNERVRELWNLYGPTETTIWSTAGRVEKDVKRINIGQPIANTQIYVLDGRGEPVPVGMPGEIWIGGFGVALGYHQRPELTAERFISDGFSKTPGARLYRTGDIGAWELDGRLYHLGRADHQVKIRGYRIELGEIESVLCLHPVVRQAIVVAREANNGSGDRRLVAYIAYENGLELTATEVRRYLKKSLPDVMIPSVVVPLDAVPTTPNGKIDRNALPDPFKNAARTANFEPPAPGPEAQIAKIWQSILKLDRVGASDNFFELGGHSLLALGVATAVENETGWRMDPRSLFFQNLRQIVMTMQREKTPASAR